MIGSMEEIEHLLENSEIDEKTVAAAETIIAYLGKRIEVMARLGLFERVDEIAHLSTFQVLNDIRKGKL